MGHLFKHSICLLSAITCICLCAYGQLPVPQQSDTLIITKMSYNFIEIQKENWPFKTVIKSPSRFIIGDQIINIKDSRSMSYDNREIAYYDENDGKLEYIESYGVITINYDKYILTCTKTSSEQPVYKLVDPKPSFMGKDLSYFTKWVASNYVLPDIAKESCIQGRIKVSFIVKADGSVSNVTITQSLDPAFDEEAVRVVSSSPKWSPGMIDGKPVNVQCTIPVVIYFR